MVDDTVFWLQVGKPAVRGGSSEPARDLADAAQLIFPMEAEHAFLGWNQAFIKLSYKYDISVMVDTLLPLLSSLTGEPSGVELASFGSDTFHTDWDITWDTDRIAIRARWHSVVGDIDWVRRRCDRLVMDRLAFLAEWKELLLVLRSAVAESGIVIGAGSEDLATIDRIVSAIPGRGRFYGGRRSPE